MGRLPKKTVDAIKEMLRQGYTTPEIAKKNKCSNSTVYRISRRMKAESSARNDVNSQLLETGSTVLQEYTMLKKKRGLRITCDQLSKTLGITFEKELSVEVAIISEGLDFLTKRIDTANELPELNTVEELAVKEEERVKDIMKRNAKYEKKRLKKEEKAKTDWLIQHYLDLGMTKHKAYNHFKKGKELCYDGLNGLFHLEKHLEKRQEIPDIYQDSHID
jgi:transposase